MQVGQRVHWGTGMEGFVVFWFTAITEQPCEHCDNEDCVDQVTTPMGLIQTSDGNFANVPAWALQLVGTGIPYEGPEAN